MSILREHLIPLSQSKSKLPGNPSKSTVIRWVKDGIKGKKSSKAIKLEVAYIGTTPYTSLEAFERWSERITEEMTG